MSKGLKRIFHKTGYPNGQQEMYYSLLAISEMQTKATIICHRTPTRFAKVKKIHSAKGR